MRERRPGAPGTAVRRALRGLVTVTSEDLQPGQAAVPEVFERHSGAVSHPEWARIEAGEDTLPLLPSPVLEPATLLSPAAQRASEAGARHTGSPRLVCRILDREAHPCQHGPDTKDKSHVFHGKNDNFLFFPSCLPQFLASPSSRGTGKENQLSPKKLRSGETGSGLSPPGRGHHSHS